jgi:hypothetical protein
MLFNFNPYFLIIHSLFPGGKKMKRLSFGILALALLIMATVPAFAVDATSEKAMLVGDAQSVDMPEAVKEIQKRALDVPADQRMQFIRDEVVRLSAQDNAQPNEQKVAEKEKAALDIKLDEQKDAMLANARQGVGNVTLGAPTDPDDFEPDNSHNQGEKLIDGFWTAKHTIAPAGDVDFFWFSGNAGDAVEIITKTANPYWAADGTIVGPADGDLDPHLTIYLPDRSVLVANDDAGAGWDAFLSVILPQSGIYYISVESSPANPTIGAYELGLAFLKQDDAEVDNDMASAVMIANGQTISDRTIFPVGDVDYFKFNVPVDYVSIQAAIVNTPAALNIFQGYLDTFPESYMHNLDPQIELYDAAGNLMPHNTGDDRFEPYNPELGWLDAELIYPYLMAGDYYLKVSHDGMLHNVAPLPATGVGAYEMTLNLAFPDPYEFDNIPAFANPIADGDIFDDHTITPHDWDVYCYEGTAGEFVEITVSTDNPCGALDPILLLWDENYELGTLLQPSWNQGPGLDAYILWGPLPYTGKYFIDVGPDAHAVGYAQADEMGSYKISLETHVFAGGIPWNPMNALPIDFNVTLKDQILARIGTYLPKNQFGGFGESMPVWYKFDGVAGEQVGAKVTTPFQYRGICPVWNNDWEDDLNPELYLVKLDPQGNPVVLAYNENLDPANFYDDAGFQFVLPEDGTYYLVVQTDVIGPIIDPGPGGKMVSRSYGRFDIDVVREPRVVDFDSDKNLGHPPLMVNFFEHCIVKDDEVVEEIVWDAMFSENALMYGPEPYFCYWLQGDQGFHDVLKTGSNIAGSVSELKEEFVIVYEPNGYAPMEVVEGVGDFIKEPWAAAVDADDYCWNGVATVKVTDAGEMPWATFKFADGKTKKVNKIRVKTDAGMGNEGRWAKHVEVVADGDISVAMIDFAGGDWHEVMIDPAVETATLKLKVLDDPLEYPGWRQISEFEAYEDIVVPCPILSQLSVTTPHLADGVDMAQLTVKLVDVDGTPITTYDDADIKFHLWDCEEVIFGALDLSEADSGIYKTTLTMTAPGAYKVVAVAHGAVIKNDVVGDNETVATIAFFGSAGQKGDLILVEGSATSKGEGWDNAIDGDREGWDGTVTTKGAPPYAIFKFTNDMKMPINKVALVTDNGFEDDAYEGRQVRNFEILVSDDMTTWTSAYVGSRSSGEYIRYEFPVVFGKYVKFVILGQDDTWAQLVEIEVLFDSKEGFQTEEVEVSALPNEYALENNYPNPFNPTTTINFQLPQDGHAELAIYNMVGQKVATLISGQVNAGYHSVTWEAATHPSGIYLYRLEAGDFMETRRMVLLK